MAAYGGMMVIDTIVSDLIRDEELRLVVYDDATGKPLVSGVTLQGNATVGVGRNIQGKGLSREEAMYLLQNDIRDCEAQLDARIPWWRHLSDARQRVLVNMCFMGIGKLMMFKNMLTALQAGNYEHAAEEILNSKYASDVGQRAVRLAEMMRVG
jgi:lysozyme